jgi:hypothetical protein
VFPILAFVLLHNDVNVEECNPESLLDFVFQAGFLSGQAQRSMNEAKLLGTKLLFQIK